MLHQTFAKPSQRKKTRQIRIWSFGLHAGGTWRAVFSESAGGLGMSTCFIEWITMTIKHGPLFFWNQTIGEDALEVFNKKSWNKYGNGNGI